MQSDLALVHSASPRGFQHSLDWRFLLPMADPARLCVLAEEEAGFHEALERAGIPVAKQLAFLNLKQVQEDGACSFVFPFGLPVRSVGAKPQEQIEIYRSIRRLVGSGSLLLGFKNARFGSRASRYYASTPRRIADQLNQAGFGSVKIFGAMPDLQIPEYIFDLEPRAVHFALHHRFRRKPAVLNILRLLEGTIGLDQISNFLPGYFAAATA